MQLKATQYMLPYFAKIQPYQLKSEPHETYEILFNTNPGIRNEHCQTVSVVGYPGRHAQKVTPKKLSQIS